MRRRNRVLIDRDARGMLWGEFDLRALFPQFAGPEIQFKGPETNYPA